MITDAVGHIAAPLRALTVSLGGLLFAWQWLQGNEALAVVVVTIVFVLGAGADWLGRMWLPAYPTTAVRALEWWVLVPGAFSAAAAGVVVILAVELAVPEGTDAETKELIGALAAGLTSFLSAGFIAWAGDEKDSRVADRIRALFQDSYRRADDKPREGRVHYFAPDSPGERWVYSEDFRGASGWGRPDRLARAKGIAHELKSNSSEPR